VSTRSAATAATATPVPTPGSALVLAGHPLREAITLGSTARYRDDVWDLSPALLQRQQQSKVLDFTTLPPEYQAVAKELFFTQLAGDLPEGERRKQPVSVRIDFTRFKTFVDWLAARGITRLVDVEPDDVDAYRKHLLGLGVSHSWRCGLRAAVHRLWVYRNHLPADRLTFDPSTLDDWYEPKPTRRTETAPTASPNRCSGRCWGGRCATCRNCPATSCAPAPNGPTCSPATGCVGKAADHRVARPPALT